MTRFCGEAILLPLKLLSETALKEKKFPDIWKLPNVGPVHKKEEKICYKTIVLSAYFLLSAKYLKE